MKIRHLLSGLRLPVTNEEQEFINRHQDTTLITSLDERDTWLAQNLVRKGVYSVANDSNRLIKKIHGPNS